MSDDPVTVPPSPYSYVLTKNEWDNVGWFTNEVGFKILFGINGGPGPRSTNATDADFEGLDECVTPTLAMP